MLRFKNSCFFIVATVLTFTLIGCSTNTNAPSPLMAGQNALTNSEHGALMGVTKDDFDHLINFSNANNTSAVTEQVAKGQVIDLDPNIHVTILDKNVGVALIEVKDEPYQGKQGYVTIESLVPDSKK